MSFTTNTVVSDGVTTQYPVAFTNGIYNRNNVKVYVEDDVDGGGNQLERSFTWINDGLIELDVVAPSGKKVTIRRELNRDEPDVNYVNGAILDESNMNQSMDQLLGLIQEIFDGVGIESFNRDLDMNGFRLTNLGVGSAESDSVTLAQVQDIIANLSDGTVFIKEESQTGAQVVADITTFTSITFTPGLRNLLVFLNGVKQKVGRDYLELTGNRIQWLSDITNTDDIDAIVNLTTTSVTNTDASLVDISLPGKPVTDLDTYLRNIHTENIMEHGASPLADGAVNAAAVQAALDTGKHVIIPSGNVFDVSAGVTGSTEGQLVGGGGTLRATANITIFEHTSERYQRIGGNVVLDGNNIAAYCYKASFPKCGLSGGECNKANTANVWLGHFSTFIDQNSRVISGNGIGVLLQDNVGQVNDIRIRDSIISGNALHGIRLATAARDGIWITGNNMENNASTAGGYSHMSAVATNALHFLNNYMENSLNTDATNSFIDIESGTQTCIIRGGKMNDSASTTPFSHFIRLATDGGDVLRRAVVEDVWADGYSSHFIENGLDTGKNNSVMVRNNDILSNTYATLISSGTGVDITDPVKSSLVAKRVTTNQNFTNSGTDAAIFNEAQDSTSQATVDNRLLPAAYDIGTGIYSAFESGNYTISAMISVTAPPSGDYFQATIMRGGTAIHGPFYSEAGNGSKNVSLPISGAVTCEAGDTIWVKIETSAGTMAMRAGGSNLSIEKSGTNYGQQA